VIGTSPGKIGTAIAQQQLRSVLSFCNSPQMNAPEAYIQFTPDLVTDDGRVPHPSTEDFLRRYMQDLQAFIERVYTVLPRTTAKRGRAPPLPPVRRQGPRFAGSRPLSSVLDQTIPERDGSQRAPNAATTNECPACGT
jgi:hypothetical protein